MNLVEFQNLDVAYTHMLSDVLKHGTRVNSHHNSSIELVGYQVRVKGNVTPFLRNARSASDVYLMGEFLWTLLGTSDGKMMDAFAPSFTQRYKDPGTDTQMSWAYGSRVRMQWERAVRRLRKAHDRRVVLSIFDCYDISRPDNQVVPCATTWQFIRSGSTTIDMIVSMRSQDAWIGLAYDMGIGLLFLQYLCELLQCRPGVYVHQVGSLHLYDQHTQKALEAINKSSNTARDDSTYLPNFRGYERDVPELSFVLDVMNAHTAVSTVDCGKMPSALDLEMLPTFVRECVVLYAFRKQVIRLIDVTNLYEAQLVSEPFASNTKLWGAPSNDRA